MISFDINAKANLEFDRKRKCKYIFIYALTDLSCMNKPNLKKKMQKLLPNLTDS